MRTLTGCDRLINVLELFYDRGNHFEFHTLSHELASPGELKATQTYDFSFKNVEKQYESYQGINVKLRFVNPLEQLFAKSHPTNFLPSIAQD
jgi:hypothetical protein